MKKSAIAFIITTYHPKMDELRALCVLLKEYPTIIVDNGGTLTLDDVGKATLLSQRKNIGYGAATNIGIHHASGLGAKWFVVLNQDIHLTKVSLASFISQIKKLPACIAGPFPAGLDPLRWTTILPSNTIDYLTGSCIAIHHKVFRKIGYFFEPYFLYYEDVDFCIRAKEAGFSLVHIILPESSHEETRSLGKGSRLHQYYLARNHFLFVRRLAPVSIKLYEFFRLPKTIGEHLQRHEKGALVGLRDYLFRRFGLKEGKIV